MVGSAARWCGRDIEGVQVSDGAGWLWQICVGLVTMKLQMKVCSVFAGQR
jgi:hypothetical protein